MFVLHVIHHPQINKDFRETRRIIKKPYTCDLVKFCIVDGVGADEINFNLHSPRFNKNFRFFFFVGRP